MPPWLRMSTVALCAGVCTGCGTGGIYWLDDKFSRLSTSGASATASSPTDAALRGGKPADGNGAAWPNQSREADGALVAPSRFRVVSNVRTVDPEPTAKFAAKAEPPIPAAFATATPKAVRSAGIPIPEPAEDDDLSPLSKASDRAVTPVSLTSKERTELGVSDRRGDDEGPAAGDAPQLPPTPVIPAALVEDGPKAAPAPKETHTAGLPPRAEPIPKATPLPTPARKLKLANVKLCKEIKGFGRTVPAGALRAGRAVLVYTEVAGRTAKRVDGHVETRLRGKLRLTPTAGGPTTEWTFPDIVDGTPAEQNEFYCFLKLHLPESLSEGDYRLEVVVDDVHGGASARGETSLHVAPAAAAAK